MNTLLDTLWYFCYITVELIVLFIAITALVEIILMYYESSESHILSILYLYNQIPTISGRILKPHETQEIIKKANPVKPSCILIPAHIKEEQSNNGHTIPQQRNAHLSKLKLCNLL